MNIKKARDIAARLLAVFARVPGYKSSGSASASLSGVLGYAADCETMNAHVPDVLRWIACPPPHSEFGDNGYSEDAAEDGSDALARLEAWAESRSKDGWTYETSRRIGRHDPWPSSWDSP